MSAQQDGVAYMCTFSGILNIIEEVLNVGVVCALAIWGVGLRTYFLNGLAIFALLGTLILITLHIWAVISKTLLPWFWIECVYSFVIGILYFLASTVVISVFTKGLIISGIIGYVTGVVYFLDTVDKYKLAVTPRAKYVWNVPDMPDEVE